MISTAWGELHTKSSKHARWHEIPGFISHLMPLERDRVPSRIPARKCVRTHLHQASIEDSGSLDSIEFRCGGCAAFGTAIRRGAEVIAAARAEPGDVLPHQRAKD